MAEQAELIGLVVARRFFVKLNRSNGFFGDEGFDSHFQRAELKVFAIRDVLFELEIERDELVIEYYFLAKVGLDGDGLDGDNCQLVYCF